MKKQFIIYIGIALILLIGGIFAWKETVKAPIGDGVMPTVPTTPTIPTPTYIETIPKEPQKNGIRDFNEADKECTKEQCKKILAEFKKFIEAPFVSSIEKWTVYTDRKDIFNLKYPSTWINREEKISLPWQSDIDPVLTLFLSPETYEYYYANPPQGLTERFPDLSLLVNRDINFVQKRQQQNLENGLPTALIKIKLAKKEAFLSNAPGLGEGDVIISLLDPGRNFLLEFSYNFNVTEDKLPIIKTIINSLEFEE